MPGMAWVKIPPDNHPVFLAAVPRDRRVTTLRMFGGLAAKAHGYMFGGLFARSAFVRLAPDDQRAALALDGAEPFDPMGNGRRMSHMILLPETVMDEPGELRSWLARSLAHVACLPPRPSKPARAKQGTAAKAKPGTGAKAKPGTGATAKLGTATAKPGTGATAKPGTAATAKPGTGATAKLKTAATAKPGTRVAAKPPAAARSRARATATLASRTTATSPPAASRTARARRRRAPAQSAAKQ
jgi:TfoX/Sxy family transcriptional regulator of competence genes